MLQGISHHQFMKHFVDFNSFWGESVRIQTLFGPKYYLLININSISVFFLTNNLHILYHQQANRLIENNMNLLEETQNRRVQLQDLLDRAEDQQQTLDAQLADMDGHRAKAINAVEDGNSVLQDATRTLQTLNGRLSS